MDGFLNNDDIGFVNLSLIVKKGWTIGYEKKSQTILHNNTDCVDSRFFSSQVTSEKKKTGLKS